MTSILELEKKLLNDIELFGWHVIKVPADDFGPSLGYSIGLYHSFDHPEVIIIGLDLEATHYLINRIGDAVREGFVFQPGQFYANLIEGVDCFFTRVEASFYEEYASYAQQFYKETTFPMLQCIYPTLSGIYPWQNVWPSELISIQPILGITPTVSTEK